MPELPGKAAAHPPGCHKGLFLTGRQRPGSIRFLHEVSLGLAGRLFASQEDAAEIVRRHLPRDVGFCVRFHHQLKV